MSIEQNKAVVRRFLDGMNNMDSLPADELSARLDELLAPDYVNHKMPGGREAFKQFIPMLFSAAPDLKVHADVDHMVAEGDYVMARIKMHYTNAGKEASGSGVTEFRLVNGKIVEDWPPSEDMALMQQVGVSLPGVPA